MTLAPDEIHILGHSAPVLLRMLRAREERILSGIYGEFKNGKQEHTMALAAFACVRDQINEITSALRQHEAQQEKKHANTDDRLAIT